MRRLARAMFILNQIRSHKHSHKIKQRPTAHLQSATHQLADSKQAVTIAYQTGLTQPNLLKQTKPMEDKPHARDINWRKFDTGADVVAAISAGGIDIGNIGSSPLAPLPPKAYRQSFW